MIAGLDDPRIQKILTPPREDRAGWKEALERFEAGDVKVTRHSVGEPAIKAIQRMLIFLGYSTSFRGSFSIDGDFGRGTNRGVAQFQFEHGLTRKIDRKTLCYPCTWTTAASSIDAIPDTRLTLATMEKMIQTALERIENNTVMCGDFDAAVSYLNDVHTGTLLSCQQILDRYGTLVDDAVARLSREEGIDIRPEWILAVIKQETGGIVRPRFEQHLLTRYEGKKPDADFTELRFRAMSQGLGQVLGENFRKVGAESALAMYTSPLDEQVLFVARYLAGRPEPIRKVRPSGEDFRTIAKYYNGSGYEKHRYHECIERWFREFRQLLDK
jgi:hypothetical protein